MNSYILSYLRPILALNSTSRRLMLLMDSVQTPHTHVPVPVPLEIRKKPTKSDVKPPTADEIASESHFELRLQPGNRAHACLDPTRTSTVASWVVDRANAHGYDDEPNKWINLSDDTVDDADIDAEFPRPRQISVDAWERESPCAAGIKPLREAVANLYNENYRIGKASKYTWENVCIVPGVRAGLVRIAAVLSNARVGFFVPENPAYHETLELFRNLTTIPIPLDKADGHLLHPEHIVEEIARGTNILLFSNPRNPTGQVIRNPELAGIQDACRDRVTLIVDESEAAFDYGSGCDGRCVSAAENVKNVDEDDVIVMDGLAGRFRVAGFRIGWVLGPKEVIKAIETSGAYLDGGANVPFQKVAMSLLLDSVAVVDETRTLQQHLRGKRDLAMARLRDMGFDLLHPRVLSNGTPYIWLDLRRLAVTHEINGLAFVDACLRERVIVAPGIGFDVAAAARPSLFDSPCHYFVRLTYGVADDSLQRALDRIERAVTRLRAKISTF